MTWQFKFTQGHGLSAHLPRGIPYAFKMMIQTLRQCIRQHLKLEQFVFMSHSYGVGVSYMYQTVFPGEVAASVNLDWVFSSPYVLNEPNFATYWKESIDKYLDYEQHEEEARHDPSKRKKRATKLTRDRAVEILLKANSALDAESAKVLLERAIVEIEREGGAEGELDFSRDIKAIMSMDQRDHYLEPVSLIPEMKRKFTPPALVITVVPASYGEKKQEYTLRLFEETKEELGDRCDIEIVKMNGTHHFHMIKPKEVAQVVIQFLDRKLKSNSPIKSKL